MRGSQRGFDAGKKSGRKRHLLVDTQGLVLAVLVHSATIVDRVGARLLLQTVIGYFPRLSHLFADCAYTGPLLNWIKTELGWDTEIVPKPENDSPEEWRLEDGQLVCKPKAKGGFQVQRQC